MAIDDEITDAARFGVKTARLHADMRDGDAEAAGALLAPLEALMRRAKAADVLERELAAQRTQKPVTPPRPMPKFSLSFEQDRQGRIASPIVAVPDPAAQQYMPTFELSFKYGRAGQIASPIEAKPRLPLPGV